MENETNEKAETKPSETKKGKLPSLGLSFTRFYEKLQTSLPALIFTAIFAFIIMLIFALAVFFMNVKGPEKVLVPNVMGKTLEDALLEMQVKELYPRINLRYSETPGDEGTILDQSPKAGAIVKGYSRVSLVVSRGVIVDNVGDYIGQNVDELELKLQALFAGQRPLITLATPEYKPDQSEAGTILEQDPPAGTSISEPVTVQLVVSRGPNYENTKVPDLIGQSINDLLQTISRSKIVFDITAHAAQEGEKAGTVVNQQLFNTEYVRNYTRMTVEIALPDNSDENAHGVFTAQLADYPYPVPMKLEAKPLEGDSYTLVTFSHPGGNVTIPYTVPHGTTLILKVSEKAVERQTVN
ncbi:MAG: PASTA domain-containing protein [Treponema sp.]|nr:PASTA domain-containing protein [Treponema sp.]